VLASSLLLGNPFLFRFLLLLPFFGKLSLAFLLLLLLLSGSISGSLFSSRLGIPLLLGLALLLFPLTAFLPNPIFPFLAFTLPLSLPLLFLCNAFTTLLLFTLFLFICSFPGSFATSTFFFAFLSLRILLSCLLSFCSGLLCSLLSRFGSSLFIAGLFLKYFLSFLLLVLSLLLCFSFLCELVLVLKFAQKLHLTFLCNFFSKCLKDALFKHPSSENGEHPLALLHLLLLGHHLLIVVIVILFLFIIIVVVIVTFLIVLFITVVFNISSRFLFSLHSTLSKLLHHL
jgi:hypothetical protein